MRANQYAPPSRERDEIILAWLAMRDRGATCEQIGRAFGASKDTVAGALWRVDRASGFEPAGGISGRAVRTAQERRK